MSDNQTESKSPEELRREAVEILQRRKRGLSGTRGRNAPAVVKHEAAVANAERALVQGRELLDKGQLAEALTKADTAIGLAPAGSLLLADSWTLMAEIRMGQKNLQAARADFSKALKINPAHIMARLGMAETYRMTSQPDRAIPIYLETIPLIRDANIRARLRVVLAEMYRQVGQHEAARRVLRIVEEENEIAMDAKAKTVLALLSPQRAFDWLVLLLVALLAILMSQSYGAAGAIITIAVGLSIYAALQVLGTPGSRGVRRG